jgi:hypothetical protein
MKKQMLAGAVALMICSSVSMAQVPTYVEASPDLGVSIQAAFPGVGDYDLYDYGIASELQFRDWFNHPWGYLIALGYGEWTTDKNASSPGSNLYDFDGNLEIVPFGASALYQIYNENALSITLDVGIRYLSTVSQITARNSDDATGRRFDVDIDDSMIARFGVSADYMLNENVIWSFGLGYQGDLTNADVSTELGPARDNIMEAFFLETALRIPL